MAQQSKPKDITSRIRHGLASVLLVAVMLQIGMFFVGFLVPMRRVESLWGKSLRDRQMVVCQPAAVLSEIARQLPEDSKIYMTDPVRVVHWNSVYFFYPRLVTATMTNGGYRTDEAYAAWDERPTEEWLMTNGFTLVMNCKNGLQFSRVPSRSSSPDDATR